MRRLALAARILAILFLCGGMSACGSDSATPTTPTPTPAATPTPAPAPTPAPTPVAAIPQLGGVWNGTSEFTQDNQRFFINMSLTLAQTNRSVSGTWKSTSAGSDQNGDFTGTIVGDGSAATINGTVNVIWETARGTGRCHLRAAVTSENAVTASSLRLIGPNIQLLDCSGNIRGLVWILGR